MQLLNQQILVQFVNASSSILSNHRPTYCFTQNTTQKQRQRVVYAADSYFRCPDDAIRTATATINIDNILTSNIYVLLDDFLYSPNKRIPQKVLTSGSACQSPLQKSPYQYVMHILVQLKFCTNKFIPQKRSLESRQKNIFEPT